MNATTTRTAVEIMRLQPESWRTVSAIETLAKTAPAGLDVVRTTTYRGGSPWLLLWGPGHPQRRDLIAQHVAAGGHAIALDLAYWQRDTKIRISFDAPHPQRWVLRRELPRQRFLHDGVRVDNVWHPNGPILVAGIGRKARVQYGDVVGQWEAEMIAAARQRWPHRQVLYRRKQADAPVPAGVALAPMNEIDQDLHGCGLVITWHSNVAVDAIRLGIPVICKEGAAAAVCSSTFLPEDPAPLPIAWRDRFLGNLAWFQWDIEREAAAMWAFVQETLA